MVIDGFFIRAALLFFYSAYFLLGILTGKVKKNRKPNYPMVNLQSYRILGIRTHNS
jgi:hypothetical protein